MDNKVNSIRTGKAIELGGEGISLGVSIKNELIDIGAEKGTQLLIAVTKDKKQIVIEKLDISKLKNQ